MTSDPIVVSYSEIEAWRQCPFKWFLAYGPLGRYSRPQKPDHPLSKGTNFHTISEFWYRYLKTGYLDAKGLDSWLSHLDPDARKLVTWMHEGYKDRWGEDDNWEIIDIEVKYIVPLYYESGEPSPFHLKVKIDLVVRDKRTDLVIVVDHKSGSRTPSRVALEFAEQFGLYEFAINRLWSLEGRSEKIFSTCHNWASTNMNKGDLIKPGDPDYKKSMRETPLEKRFVREYVKRPLPELINIERETLLTLEEMYPQVKGTPAHTLESIARHPDKERCQRMCDFTTACLVGRRANNNQRTIDSLEMSGYDLWIPEKGH